MNNHYGRHVPLWRRVLGLEPRPTWHDQHPLPEGFRPRTKVDVRGRLVEPWGFVVTVHGDVFDAGEWWLPVGLDPDQAAYEVLTEWLDIDAFELEPWERRGVQMAARRSGYDSRVGIAHAQETALTGRR